MQICNNIKVSQINYSTIYYFSIFDVQLDIRNEREKVYKMWENAYMYIFEYSKPNSFQEP